MSLPEVICRQIATEYKMVEWIGDDWNDSLERYREAEDYICKNFYSGRRIHERRFIALNPSPHVVKILKENPKLISWQEFCSNTNEEVIHLIGKLLEKNSCPEIEIALESIRDKLCWIRLSANPSALPVLKSYPEKIEWEWLSKNFHPEAIEMLKANPEKIAWYTLSANTNPKAIEMLLENREKIEWENFSKNSSLEAVKFLKEHEEKINWAYFSENSHPEAVAILLENREKIDWYHLSFNTNPKIIDLFRERPERLEYLPLKINPAIFRSIVNEELLKVLMAL